MLRILVHFAWFVLLVSTVDGAAAVRVDQPAPEGIIGRTVSGNPVKVSDYVGKVVVISFWASWCPPCRKELPILEGLQVAGKGNIQVIAVNIESEKVFRNVVKAIPEAHVRLVNDWPSNSRDVYGAKAIPQMVIVGKDGRILSIHKGYGEKSLDGIVDEVNKALTTNPGS